MNPHSSATHEIQPPLSTLRFGAVEAVNVGAAQPMMLQGQTVMTGFAKVAVPGTSRVTFDGVERDVHVDDAADRNRAVLLYQRSYYDAWDAELGRTLPVGMFGENLTIKGPPDEEVMLGDRLRIGKVLLEVTQPRIPCNRMAVRFGRDDMPARYMRTGRVGFFCKVILEGELSPGDEIELVERGGEGISMADVARILHRQAPNKTELTRLTTSATMPAAMKAKAQRLLDRLEAERKDWKGTRDLVVTSRVQETTDVVSFELHDSDGQWLPGFAAGQFLTIALDVSDRDRPLVRTYTLVGRSDDDAGYRIAVKREPAPAGSPDAPTGAASGHLHDQVHVGSRVQGRAPRGHFVVRTGTRPVVLISAGIGVTPMVAMLRELLRAGDRNVYFFHGARSSADHAFAAEVRDRTTANPQTRVHVAYSRPGPSDVIGQHFDVAGRLTAAVVAGRTPTLDADFYVCGPVHFMAAMVRGLLDLGVPTDQVHYEFFGATTSLLGDDNAPSDMDTGSTVLDADGRPIVVTFARSGITRPWREGSYSLLTLAESAGLRPDASCRTGLCGTCVVRVDDGDVTYAVQPMDADPSGQVTLCCARPSSSMMLDL